MNFLYIEFLTLLLFIPMIYLYLKRYKKKLETQFDKTYFNRLLHRDNFLKYRVFGLLISLILLIFTLARPVIEKDNLNIKNYGVDVAIAIDISASMRANDLKPNRFEIAKEKLKELITLDITNRFALLAYTTNTLVISPPTEDRELLYYLFDSLNLNSVVSKGSNLMSLLKKVNKLIKTKDKILILFSDGGNKKYFDREISYAKENNIKVFILGIATNRGTTLKEKDKNLIDKNGNLVISSLNNNIKALAKSTGGEFIKVGFGDIRNLHRNLRTMIDKRLLRESEIKDYIELFYIFIIISIILFFISIFSFKFKFKQASLLIFIFFTLNYKIEAGILDFYYAKEYKKAITKNNLYLAKKYLKKIESNEAYFNLGVLLYREKSYKKAIKYFFKIKSRNIEFKSKNFYNLANSYAQLKKFKKADKFYLKSLLLKYNKDTDFNREFIKKFAQESKIKEIKKQKLKENIKENKNLDKEFKILSTKEISKLEESIMNKLQNTKRPLSFKQYDAINRGSKSEKKPY